MERPEKILDALADAWNLFLDEYHFQEGPRSTDDLNDFRKCIHDAERIIMTKEYLKGADKMQNETTVREMRTVEITPPFSND